MDGLRQAARPSLQPLQKPSHERGFPQAAVCYLANDGAGARIAGGDVVDGRNFCAPSAVPQRAGQPVPARQLERLAMQERKALLLQQRQHISDDRLGVSSRLRPTTVAIATSAFATNAVGVCESVQREEVLRSGGMQPVATTQHQLPVGWSGLAGDLPGQMRGFGDSLPLRHRKCSPRSCLACQIPEETVSQMERSEAVGGFVKYCQVSEYCNQTVPWPSGLPSNAMTYRRESSSMQTESWHRPYQSRVDHHEMVAPDGAPFSNDELRDGHYTGGNWAVFPAEHIDIDSDGLISMWPSRHHAPCCARFRIS
eukprot:SAG11_NODE_819_length_7017_cov_3.801821_3_plen_311_part_00